MDPLPIDKTHAIYLLIAVGWTTLFSMISKRPVRGLRNLGILACYVLAIVMLIRLRFVTALLTWCAFGIVSGLIYSFYEWVAYARDKQPGKQLRVSISTFIHGQLAWPIMIPEAIEYLLAELGVLRAPPAAPPTQSAPSKAAPPNTDLPPTA